MLKFFDGILSSHLLKKKMPYRIVLPNDYGKTDDRFPVLYLLHGLFGSYQNWIDLTKLLEYAQVHNFIIVTPEGEDGWYVDSAKIERNKFENYIITELIPEIETLYRTKENRENRAIAGLSMGGFGALKFGIKYPDLFIFAGSISGAFNAPRQTEKKQGVDWETMKSSILKAFGDEGSKVRIENDLFEIIPQVADKKRLPFLYVDCGDEDAFLQTNIDFNNLLNQHEIVHNYFIGSGGHDWDYWDKRIKEILKIVSDFIV